MPKADIWGVSTYYEMKGIGEPIVFIHPFRHDHKVWDSQVDFFVKEGYRTITYDLRGHGKTDGSTCPKYNMDVFARDLYILIEKLRTGMPHIVGTSLGGMIAESYAAKYPLHLKSLAVVSSVYPERTRMLSIFLFLKTARIYREEWMKHAREGRYSADKDEMLKIKGAISSFEQDLGNVSVPVLVVSGENEYKVMQGQSDTLERMLGAQRAIIPNSGHHPNRENPEVFNEILLRFLRGELA